MVLLHSTLSIDTQALRRLRISRWCVYVCLLHIALFRLLVCLCVCVFFTFYRCFAEYEKVNTVRLRYLHYTFGRLVGWLAGWFAVVSMYFSFVHISFVFIIYFHNVYTEKTNI